MKVSVLGSNATRQAFNYYNELQLGTYVTRTSLISLMSKPLNISITKLKNENNMQKRIVYWDLNKILKNKVFDLEGEYLVIDFLDERLRKIIVNESIITLSNELIKSGYIKDKKKEYIDLDINQWKLSCDDFYTLITKKYDEKNIILNKIFLSEKYFDKQGNIKYFTDNKLKEIKEFNSILNIMYIYFEQKFTESNILEIEDIYLADENHIWGLEPYHYEEKFYIKLIEKINDIVDKNKQSEYENFKNRDFNSLKAYLASKNNSQSEKIVEELIENNIINTERFEGFELVEDKDIWIDELKYSRSYLRMINGFSFLLDMVYAFEKTKNKKYISKSIEIIQRWFNDNNFDKHKNTMAFHDETTALRLENMLMFIIKLKEYISEDDLKYILNKLDETAEILSRDNFHTTLTNHGMFQDLALLKYSIFLERGNWKQYDKVAVNRLKSYFNYVYTKDGIAKEHAPIYHLMITQNLIKSIRLMKLNSHNTNLLGNIEDLVKKAERFIVDIMRLDGTLPNIADTEIQVMPQTYKNLFKSQEIRFVNSNGKEGRCPNYLDKVYKDSGYAIFRDGWNKDDAQVIFTAAYHSAYHKHTDDLNILFYDGEDILVEAGPNGYNYKDEFTKYAYSARAHNTLAVLNKPLPRTDGKFNKVKLLDYKINDKYSEVLGENDRYEDINHKRKVKFIKDTKILEVEDYITSSSENLYEINWNFNENFELKINENQVFILKDNKEIGLVKIFSNKSFELNIYKGFKGKSIKGWKFPKMESKEPISNLAITCNASNVKFYTQVIMYKNIKDEILKEKYIKENIYCCKDNIKYIFEENKDSKKLCIVFPSMLQKYEEIDILKECKANKLFLLDHMDYSSSYIYENDRIIDKIISENDILLKNTIFIGRSEGAYDAIYNGLRRHVGNIIAIDPKFNNNNSRIDKVENELIVTNGYQNKYLNNIPYNEVEVSNNKNTIIDMCLRKKDYNNENYLVKYIKQVNKNLNIDIVESNNDLDYQKFLLKKLNEIDMLIYDAKIEAPNITTHMINHKITVENNCIKINLDKVNKKSKFAYYLFKENTCIYTTKYSINTEYKSDKLESGKYRVRIFEMLENKERKSLYSNWINIQNDNDKNEISIDGSVSIYSTQDIKEINEFKIYNGYYYISNNTSELSTINSNNQKYCIDCSGAGIIDGKLVLNSKDLIPILDNNIKSTDLHSFGDRIRGSFCLTMFDKNECKSMILPDPLGSEVVFYYKNEYLTAFSSNINSLVNILDNIGIKLEKSMDYINEVISTSRGGFFESSYEGVNSLRQFEFIVHQNNKLSIEVYSCKNSIFKNEKSYDELLEMASNEIVENINAISEYSDCEYKISHLTGGFDSRLVLAAILNSNNEDKYHFYCSGRIELPDRYIAECIASEFNLKMTEYSGLGKSGLALSKNIEDELLEPLKFTGGILSTQCTSKDEKNKNIILSGGYGEYLRSIYGKSVPQFKLDMDIYEVMRLLWGNNFSINDLEDKSILSKAFIDKLASKILKEINIAKDLGVREDAILDYLFISIKYRYFGGVISTVTSRCIPRFDILYSQSIIKCALNQSQDVRTSNVIGFDLMKKLNNKLPFYPFDGNKYEHKFNEFRGDIKYKELEYKKPNFYLEDKIKVYESSELVNISENDIKKAKKIRGSAYQIAMLPIVQKKCSELLKQIPRKEIDDTFNRVVLSRLLRNDLRNRAQIRTVINLYSYLLWYKS